MIVLPSEAVVGLTVGGLEIGGNNYSRQTAPLTDAGDGLHVINLNTINWPLAWPYGWGTIDSVLLWATDGTFLASAIPVVTVTVTTYTAPRIRPGKLTLFEGNSVGYGYGTRKWGVGRYARLPGYAMIVELIEIGFARYDPCVAGTWTPADACAGAAWDVMDPCSEGVWAPAPGALRRVA